MKLVKDFVCFGGLMKIDMTDDFNACQNEDDEKMWNNSILINILIYQQS